MAHVRDWRDMARGISFDSTATSTVLFILVLLQATLIRDDVLAAPAAKRNDILAGTEFLSVFINGAMATPPPTPSTLTRRRGSRRGGPHISHNNHNNNHAADSVVAESRHEASIYRIRTSSNTRPISIRQHNSHSNNPSNNPSNVREEEVVRFYPISHRTLENHNNKPVNVQQSTQQQEQPTSSEANTKSWLNGATMIPSVSKSNNLTHSVDHNRQQKVIGVSVTSTVKATPYKVRVEHNDNDAISTVSTRLLPTDSFSNNVKLATNADNASGNTEKTSTVSNTIRAIPKTASTTMTTTKTTTTTTMMTPIPARLVTEELNNIVSESNRSEFSVEEGYPSTSWRDQDHITSKPTTKKPYSSLSTVIKGYKEPVTESIEQNYELPEENSETREYIHYMEPVVESSETRLQQPQGRKAGRHYDASNYNQQPESQAKSYTKTSRVYDEPVKIYSEPARVYGEPEKVYSEPAKIYGEPAKVYGEPAKVYGEPARIYGEPSRVYSEPEKIYSEPSKIYSEPAKVYGEPAKIYSQPSKVYGVPSRIYDNEGKPIDQSSPSDIYDNGDKSLTDHTSPTSTTTTTTSQAHHSHHTHHHHHHPHREPEEQNYEVDESVSVGSNGNVHGPQIHVTEQPQSSSQSEMEDDGHKVSYVVEGRNYRKYRVEERTPDGFIVGEYGVVSHDDGTLRGVRYTADGTINPRLIYDALMKFLAL